MLVRVLLIFVVIFLKTCFHQGQSLDIVDCGSYFTFENVRLETCNQENESCPLYIGSAMKITFAINTEAFNIVGGLINDIGIYVRGGPKFDLLALPENPCEILTCPLDAYYNATYTAYIYVDSMWPPLSGLDLKWILKTADSKGDQLLCFQFPVTLQY